MSDMEQQQDGTVEVRLAALEANGCAWCYSCGRGYVAAPEVAEEWIAAHNAEHEAAK